MDVVRARHGRDVDHLVTELPSDIMHGQTGGRVNAGQQPIYSVSRNRMPQPPQVLLGFDIQGIIDSQADHHRPRMRRRVPGLKITRCVDPNLRGDGALRPSLSDTDCETVTQDQAWNHTLGL
jgi:hypothetical protein